MDNRLEIMDGEISFHYRFKNDPDDIRSLDMLADHALYLETVWKEKMKEKAELLRENERLSRMTDKVFSHIPR